MHHNHVYISQKEAADIVGERQASDGTTRVFDVLDSHY